MTAHPEAPQAPHISLSWVPGEDGLWEGLSWDVCAGLGVSPWVRVFVGGGGLGPTPLSAVQFECYTEG